MGSPLLKIVLQLAADPAKALTAGAQSVGAGAQAVDASAKSLQKSGSVLTPYVPYLLGLLAVVLASAAIYGLVKLVQWWRGRRSPGQIASGPPPISPDRLLQIRRKFLAGLPFANRAAVVDLPTVVVLGPAGGGKTQLIGLDVDWQRQARQFLPSYTADAAMQIYLGPDCTVQEVSAPLLEDDTLSARVALRRLWRKSFGDRQKGLAVVALDVRWLTDTPPDEQRRMAQLLRGKLNLISEACRGPVETRLCLTHMDGLEGFEDFARLLRSHGVALSFDIPKQGEDGLASLIDGQEQYLALGLTSLPVDAFERLERFYSQAGRSFAGLGRFVSALLEGDTLSYKPRLTRVFLSSLTAEARASGTLSVATEGGVANSVRRPYLETHKRRAALIAAACCLPIIAAYAHFYLLLGEAQKQVADFENTVAQKELEGRGEVVEQQVNEAADKISHLWSAAGWWPPLRSSFPDEMLALRTKLAHGIRESHLQPALAHCHKHPEDCRPEQVVYMLAALHASNGDRLGDFVRASVQPENSRQWLGSGGPLRRAAVKPGDKTRTWIAALELRESLVATYVLASDEPWSRNPPCRPPGQVSTTPEDDWSCWPYTERLTMESQLRPWADHLHFLKQTLEAGPKELPQLGLHREERERLQAQLNDLDVYSQLPEVLNLIDASSAPVKTKNFPGIESTVEVLEWLKDNRDTLAAILHMEEEAYAGYVAVEKMSPPELLTRDGLWLTGSNKGPFRVELLQQAYLFRPEPLSRGLLQSLLEYYEKNGRMTVGPQEGREGQLTPGATPFESEIKPLVDDFTQRLKNAQLPTEEAAKREAYIQNRVKAFAQDYRQKIFDLVRGYRFTPPRSMLLDELSSVSQPSSRQVDMLREVARLASIGPLEGPYYEPLRNAVAPFQPIVTVMAKDPKSGSYAALMPYQALLAKMHDELDAVTPTTAGKDKAGKGADGAADKDKGGKDKAKKGEDGADGDGAAANADLTDLISPLEKVSLAMLLEEDGSYLRKVNEWLDQQAIVGELRKPFLAPFMQVQELGKKELEATLSRQWEENSGRMLRPMLARYPFNPDSQEDVDPNELEVLRRKDGAFWRFATQVYSRVAVERGTQWSLRGPLREKLALPNNLLATLSQVARLSKVLWEEDGRPKPLMLRVQPQPLPPSPVPNFFITMSSLKCGKTAARGFNQSPTWQDFPVTWWDQQVSSIVLELNSPSRDVPLYVSMPWSHSAWSCFRLFEEATLTADQRRQWSLSLQGSGMGNKALDISFDLKGEPWAPFREVPR